MTKIFNTTNMQLLSGTFGLERETLRVTAEGSMARSPHPFPDDPHIVKDFCENQAEINTGVHDTAQGAIDELSKHSKRLTEELDKRGERLWLYSNPPAIKSPDDIPVAVYEGDRQGKHQYRLYLAEKYGKYKMTLSGIHSPVCDGSYFSPDRLGETVVTDYASIRCGKEGYWNNFTPILYYGDILEYAGSIQRYLISGTLAGVGELYYPIRLKPKGANRLNNLVQNGVNHIELRNIDINPFAKSGLDVRDLQFIELLCLWIYSNYKDKLSYNDQIRVTENLKNAALYDIDSTTINGKEPLREAGLRVLGEMKAFYGETELIKYQIQKLTEPGKRYAERVCDSLKNNYILDYLSRNHK